MRILFLTDDFPPDSFGGAGIAAYNLAKGLQKRGHELFVITTIRKKTGEKRIKLEGLNIFKIYANYHERWRSWLGLYSPQTVSKVEKIIKEIKPDACHFHHIHQYLSYYCLKIAKKYSKVVFLTAHDVMFFHYGKLMPKNGNCMYKVSIWDQMKEAKKRYNPFRNIIIGHYLKYVDKIFAVSNSLKKLLEINGIKNIETIYNGIDIEGWKIDLEEIKKFKEKYNLSDKKVIFFGGRISGAKGGNQILKSLFAIKKIINNIVLIVAGEENQYTQNMKRMIQELKINKNVIFTGLLSGNELKAAYHISDICILPSLCFETFGMINLEAMTSKKPVISTYFGGPKEVVLDNQTGYLINPNNIELMTEKILDLLQNSQKAKQFGEAGYERAQKYFSIGEQINKTLEWYRKYV